MFADALTEAPRLETVGGSMRADVLTDAPKLETVGGSMRAHALANAPMLETVGGVMFAEALTDAPKLTKVSGRDVDPIVPAITTKEGEAKESRAPKKGQAAAAPAQAAAPRYQANKQARDRIAAIRERKDKELYDKALPRVAKLVEERMNKLGLGKFIKKELHIKLADSSGSETNGSYLKRLISLAIAGKSDKQIMSTLNHESIHAIKELNIITPEEWANLKKLVDKKGWLKTFRIQSNKDSKGEEQGRYPNLSLEEQYEEAIADAFATYVTGRSPVLGYNQANLPIYVYKKDLNLAGQPVGIINRILRILRLVKDVAGEDAVFKRLEKPIAPTQAETKQTEPKLSVAPKFAKDANAAYASKKEVTAVRSMLPLHPEWMEHMQEKFLWESKPTGDYKNERKVFEKGGKKFVIGRITPEDWIDRVESVLTPQTISDSRNWYKNIKLEFQRMFSDDWHKYMVAYLLGNKAESPRGALNNALYVAEEIKTMTSGARKGGLSDEQMRQIFKGEPVSLVGIGAKLYDFVDSALGKTTRSWMGDTVEGNSPFVVDRHTFRDSGRVDDAIISYIEKTFGETSAQNVQLDTKQTGNVSPAQYEKIANWGNELTEYLNNINYMGGNWTPLETQAVGWTAMSRLTETAEGGTTEQAVDAMTKTIPIELDFGAGAPYNVKFKSWHDLLPEAKSRVTHKVMRAVADVVAEFSGTKVRDFTEGVGGWGPYVNPNAVIRFLSSDQTAEALTAMAAYLGHQTKVYAFHPASGQTGDSVAFDIAPVGGAPFTNADITKTIWPELFKRLDPVMGKDAEGNSNAGFVQAKTSDGRPTIRIVAALPTGIFTSGPKKGQLKTIKDLTVAERMLAEKSLINKLEPVLTEALENIAGTYSLSSGRVKVVSSSNNWKEQENGESHKQRVVQRFGSVLQRRLDDVGVPRVEAAIQRAIDEETGVEQTGDGGRRIQGRANAPLEGSPVVQGASGPDQNLVAIAEQYA